MRALFLFYFIYFTLLCCINVAFIGINAALIGINVTLIAINVKKIALIAINVALIAFVLFHLLPLVALVVEHLPSVVCLFQT